MKLYLTVLFILFTISSYAKDLVVVDIDFIIKQEKLNEFNKEKTNKYAELVSYINDFLVNYSKENNIKVIIDKKNILISRNDIDITKDILNIINE
jgi:Skp family chaperone for outer membrane proteins